MIGCVVARELGEGRGRAGIHLMRDAIRGDQRHSEALRGDQRPFEVIRGHQRSSEVIRVHLE